MKRWITFVAKLIAVFMVFLIAGLGAFLQFSPTFGAAPSGDSLARIEASPNFYDGRFHNLVETVLDTSTPARPRSFSSFVNPAPGKHPQAALPSCGFDSDYFTPGRFVWLGHSTVLFNSGGTVILADPVFHRASPVPLIGEPFDFTHRVVVEDLPDIDVVIISHDHYDHLDHKAIIELNNKVGRFFVPLGLAAHLERWGVAPEKIIEFDWYDSKRLLNVDFILTPARHFSGRSLTNRFSTLWGSWVVVSDNLNVYFSGDGGYSEEFKKIGEQYGPFDIAFIENGAYNSGWAQIHMFPEQSVQASIDLQARVFFPIHWSKFDLSIHSWAEPAVRALAYAEKRNVIMASPLVGEIFSSDVPPLERWWQKLLPKKRDEERREPGN